MKKKKILAVIQARGGSKSIPKKNNAIVFFNELIKKVDNFLLTDLNVTTAIDHKKAAISIAIYPIKGVDINLLIYIYSIT